jgi:hypothetical protein
MEWAPQQNGVEETQVYIITPAVYSCFVNAVLNHLLRLVLTRHFHSKIVLIIYSALANELIARMHMSQIAVYYQKFKLYTFV